MNKTLIVSVIAILSALAGIGHHLLQGGKLNISTEITKYQAWVDWQAKYGKIYSNEEIPLKYSVFSANYDFIQSHNSENHKYTVGLNQFADLTSEEFASFRMPIKQTEQIIPTKQIPVTQIAKSINWHNKGAVGPVNNQGQCGSCWAFSATEAIEGIYEISGHKYTELSIQQIVDCSSYTGAQGCDGGWPQWAYEYVQKYGIETAADYPYTGETDTCQYNSKDVVFKIGGYVNITANEPSQMLSALQTQPLSVCIEADSSSFQFYTSGIYDDAGCGTSLDHCVLLDGYDNSGSTPYWIVQNSWGSSWGNQGYIWIEQSSGAGICGINTWATYPTA